MVNQMKNVPLVKQLYIVFSVIFMTSCDRPMVTVFSNCVIPSFPAANSIACADGKITSIGKDLTGDIMIDLEKGVVYPGFMDAHLHLVWYGKAMEILDLVGTKSVDEITGIVSQVYDGSDRWIIGRGWDQNDWEIIQYPNKESLDKVAVDQPVYLHRIDGHAIWVNSNVLSICGINRNTADPIGGKILRDSSGNPTGVFIDNAMDLIKRFVPDNGKNDKRRQIINAVRKLNQFGLTAIHDAGTDIETVHILKELIAQEQLNIRVNAMLNNKSEDYQEFLSKGPDTTDKFLSVRTVKIYFDGAMGSRGAALLEPYADDPKNIGLNLTDEKKITEKVNQFNAAGFQVAIHCIGDRANRLVLDIFEESGNQNARNRIEHAQIIHSDDLHRFFDLGVIPSMQATHCTSDMYWIDERLGDKRLHEAYAWQSLLQTGSIIPGGSDAPVEIPNPLLGIHAAVTRQDTSGWPAEGWQSNERMTIDQALASITSWSAYSMFAESYLGKIKPGFMADFTVLSQDLSTIDPEQIPSVNVHFTIVRGKVVYKR
jgi:hypothetical protein